MCATPVKRDAGAPGAGREPSEPNESSTAVVFRGDGEPLPPRALLDRLAEAESAIGFEPDNYSLGGTVEKLERRFAGMLGKEAAIFLPTGTLANHLAIRALCGAKPRAIVQEQSHLYRDSGDCVTQLSGINLIPLAQGRPCFTLEEVREAVDQSSRGRVDCPVGALMIESPVRRQMGQVAPFQEMRAITGFCRSRGIGTHLDGARLYMMSAASGIEPREYAGLFDTVYVSLYKYFGAPFGAILAGDSSLLAGMFHTRRMFGGGLASSCLVAALALQGSEGFEERFKSAMSKARALFKKLNALPGIEIEEFRHGSNIFPLRLGPGVSQEQFLDRLRQRNMLLYPDEGTGRVSSVSVNTTILRQSNDAIVQAFRVALSPG